MHITAFDQRGHGKTAHEPHALTAESDEVMRWKSEGKRVNLAGKHAKRVTGGWAKVMPDIEWFVQRESERAKARNKKLFLWGFSMVSRDTRKEGLVLNSTGRWRSACVRDSASGSAFARNRVESVRRYRWRIPHHSKQLGARMAGRLAIC